MTHFGPCNYKPIQPSEDGCVSGIRRCSCGRTYEQRKRRKAGVPDEVCTWVLPCRNHPDKTVSERNLLTR